MLYFGRIYYTLDYRVYAKAVGQLIMIYKINVKCRCHTDVISYHYFTIIMFAG